MLLNAGMAIYLANDDYTIADGIKRAAELIDSGAALGRIKAIHHCITGGDK